MSLGIDYQDKNIFIKHAQADRLLHRNSGVKSIGKFVARVAENAFEQVRTSHTAQAIGGLLAPKPQVVLEPYELAGLTLYSQDESSPRIA